MPRFPYKSYCWCLGTTSFRTVNFNLKIETQLNLLNEFWNLPENKDILWRDSQIKYYQFMHNKGFVKGDAPRPDKDARQKTSGLTDIGLLDAERRLTPVGKVLLEISKNNNFKSNNQLNIPADSYIFLKQLLKSANVVEEDIVRPFAVTLYNLLSLEYLTEDEFTYLLPLCTNILNTKEIIENIKKIRKSKESIDDIIISRLMKMDNYKLALDYFMTASITEEVIIDIGINRKSRSYDRPYYGLYKLLYEVVIQRKSDCIISLYEQIQRINGNPSKLWEKYIFKNNNRSTIKKDGKNALNDFSLLHASSEQEFKILFFKQIHLFKAKATLSDYADLNKRYFKTTDIILFSNKIVQLDVIPRCWLYLSENDLLKIAFGANNNLKENIELEDIAPFLSINLKNINKNLELLYGLKVETPEEINQIINEERQKRFDKLINEKFNRATLIDLFEYFKEYKKNTKIIRNLVTENAEIYTIFEYLVGIAWYLISDRNGNILDYMKLSLEADLLPRSHATGGSADIEYIYNKSEQYPAHCLLIEVTLTDESNQRRAEMEPVSRHLGEYMLKSNNKSDYCIFIAPYLDINVINDFRGRKLIGYLDPISKKKIHNMKILTLSTDDLKRILQYEINYKKLYKIFDNAYNSNESEETWYDKEIKEKITYENLK